MYKTTAMLEMESRLGEPLESAIYRMYWGEEMTTYEIATKLDVGKSTPLKWMSLLEIPRRTNSSSKKLQFRNTPEHIRKEQTRVANGAWREKFEREGDFIDRSHMFGETNPARNPEARAKISAFKTESNPMHDIDTVIKVATKASERFKAKASPHEEILKRGLSRVGYFPEFQHVVHRYILDFAFTDVKVCVELDGIPHLVFPQVAAKDARRDSFLESRGWIVLRFLNSEIEENLGECIRDIIFVVEENRKILRRAEREVR